jgi:hypothetical protein
MKTPMEGTAVSPNFNAPGGGRVRRNTSAMTNLKINFILKLDIVAWWTVKTGKILTNIINFSL